MVVSAVNPNAGRAIFVTHLRIISSDELALPRAILISNIWSGNGLPVAGADVVSNNVPTPNLNGAMPTNLLRSDSYTFVLRNNSGIPVWTNIVYSFIPTNTGTRLVIYHAGHDGYIPTYYTQPDYQNTSGLGYNSGDLVRKLVENGYTVVGVAMPFLQQGHSGYIPTPNGTINYLRFFVEPCIRIINQFPKSTKVFMTGISGGGWTTTLVSAIDIRILVSAPTAGSLPLYIVPEPRDWEQFLPGLSIDYTNLYVMAADRPGRVQTQFLNSNDGCCFAGVDALANVDYTVSTIAQAASYGGTWSRYITVNWLHSYDIDIQTNIINLFNSH